jgi:hypothetical protein
MSYTGSPPYTRTQLSHPVASIIFYYYSYRGVEAIVGLRRPTHGATGARAPQDAINVAVVHPSNSDWQISPIGYEF